MITIKEIALLAKVSKSTVSKALNNRTDISEETRQRIMAIAREHQFTPSAFAKGLTLKMTENIGVLFSRDVRSLSGNPFYSRVLEGVEAAICELEYSLLLHLVTEERTGLPKMLRRKEVDGIILIGPHVPGYAKMLQASATPIVLVDPNEVIDDCSCVVINNEQGAFEITRHIIECGHRRIGFISDEITRHSFEQRLQGFRRAHAEAELPLDESMVRCGQIEAGYELTMQLLDQPNPPTAIFATNDLNAILAYKAIDDRRLSIPRDIGVAGFDDIDLADKIAPSLTTVRVPKQSLGRAAAELLHRAIVSGSLTTEKVVIGVELVRRNSIGTLA